MSFSLEIILFKQFFVRGRFEIIDYSRVKEKMLLEDSMESNSHHPSSYKDTDDKCFIAYLQ